MPTPNWKQFWSTRCSPFAAECRSERDDFLADLTSPAAAQARVFNDILGISHRSLHWRRNGYDYAVTNPGTFKSVLPIMRFDDFRPLLEEEFPTKGGVLSCSPIVRWLKTSGTSGTPKHVPYTLHWLTRYRIPAIKAMWGCYLNRHPEILDHPHATLDTQSVREPIDEFIHGLEYQAISNRDSIIPEHDWAPPWYEAPWYDSNVPPYPARRSYYRLRCFLGKDLRYICSINPSMLISLRDFLVARAEEFIRDVADGTLEGRQFCAPDPDGARRLETILARKGVSFIDVWPNLSLYSCWLTGSAGLYRDKLDKIFPGVDTIPFMSCGTEGVVTIPIDGSVTSQPLAVNQAYFEFIPAAESLDKAIAERSEKTLAFNEVETGHDYHLIMSQANGLYRLATGDIYRVESIVAGVPWLSFLRRDGVFHSFTGEKITENQVTSAIDRAFAKLHFDKGLYMCGPRWGELPNYVVLVETCQGRDQKERIAYAIDKELKDINIEYASKRDSNRLAPIEVMPVADGAINRYVDSKRHGSNTAQFKYKPFHQSIEFIAEIMNEEANDPIALPPHVDRLSGESHNRQGANP